MNAAGIASFAAVTFDGKAVFTASTFHDEAHFAASVFNRPAVFSKSLFGGVARFAGVVTKQSAMFSNVRFASAADFSGASLTQYGGFWWGAVRRRRHVQPGVFYCASEDAL